ncbi:MAG: hypothetical protein ACLP01_13525 [Solirubrobacteraceae bacterium]
MSTLRTDTVRHISSGASRITQAWKQLARDRRLAAIACCGLFLSLFLPWYQETVFASGAQPKSLLSASASLTGWGAFSFVEAAVLLVAVGVLVLLFERAEGRAFHLPGGDGSVITAAGGWTCLLVIWRIFDKSGATSGTATTSRATYASISGIEWGIFVALALAGLLTYAGTRIRSARQPEPQLPGEDGVYAGRWQGREEAAPGSSEETSGRPARGPAAAPDASATLTQARPEPEAGPQPRPPTADPDRTLRRESGARQAVGAETSAPEQPDRSGGRLGAETSAPEQPDRSGGRSSWRPAERPEWSDPERPLGWLTAPRARRTPPDAPADPPPPAVEPGEDPTVGLPGRE